MEYDVLSSFVTSPKLLTLHKVVSKYQRMTCTQSKRGMKVTWMVMNDLLVYRSNKSDQIHIDAEFVNPSCRPRREPNTTNIMICFIWQENSCQLVSIQCAQYKKWWLFSFRSRIQECWIYVGYTMNNCLPVIRFRRSWSRSSFKLEQKGRQL